MNRALVTAQMGQFCERVGMDAHWITYTAHCSISLSDRKNSVGACHVQISNGNLVSGTKYKMPHWINVLINVLTKM